MADRLAFVASMERHAAIVVVELDGWYVACATERTLAAAELAQLRAPEGGAPRLMSIVTERGITPALVQALYANLWMFATGAVGVGAVAGGVTYFVSRRSG